MSRRAFVVSYNGAYFSGWQRLAKPRPDSFISCNSVAGLIERAFSQGFNRPCHVVGSGRTDAGVHATHQVFHVDLISDAYEDKAWVSGLNHFIKLAFRERLLGPYDHQSTQSLNSHLLKHLYNTVPIRISHSVKVPSDFHARYAAFERSYRYIIHNPMNIECRHLSPSQGLSVPRLDPGLAMSAGYIYIPDPLDITMMNQACKALMGIHDFTAFRSVDCPQAVTVREMIDLQVTRSGDFVLIDLKANAFLRGMCRLMAGALVEVGLNKLTVASVKEILDAKQPSRMVQMSKLAPQGLYLTNVTYPDVFKIPEPCLYVK